MYVGGDGKGTDNTACTPSGANRVSIGRKGASTPSEHMSGRIGFVAIWSLALTHGQVKESAQDPWGLITPRAKTYFYSMAGAPPAANVPAIMNYLRRQRAA